MLRALRRNWELTLVVALAALVYRPWDSPALPLTDFGVFMAKMDPSESWWEQYLSVTAYHVSEGRLALVQYAYMVFGRNVFGFDPVGWHWMYFVLNCMVIVLARELMLRTRVRRAAALAGVSLWATMPPVAEGWIRPTGEPYALVFFLAAACLLVNYNEREDWLRRAVLVALCSAGVVLSKEILVVLLPAAWLVSRVRFGGEGSHWAPWTPRDAKLVGIVGSVVALVGAAVAYVVISAPHGYAAQYGETAAGAEGLVQRLELILIPVSSKLGMLSRVARDPAWILLLALPSLLWIRLVATGSIVGGRRGMLWPLAIALMWIGLGVIAYQPWTAGGGFYYTPFALGAMFAAAHAMTHSVRHSGSERRLALGTAVLLLCIASVEARSVLYKFQLRAVLNDAVVKNLERAEKVDVLVGAVPRPVQDERWWWSRNLEGYVTSATSVRIGESRDVTCERAQALAATRGVVIVSREGACGRISEQSHAITAYVPRMHWPYLWETQRLRDRVYVTVASATGEQVASGISHDGGSCSARC